MGVIYATAPDLFETDPIKLVNFNGIFKNKQKALDLLKKSADLKNV
jgi:hypothetical protein